MKDITTFIKKSISQNILWSIKLFFEFISKLKNNSFQISYWEDEENWATILENGKVIGYVWKKYPTIFVLSLSVKRLSDLIKKYEFVEIIEVENLDHKDLTINYHHLKEYIESGLNYNSFSANDFWYHTNSI